MFVQPEAQYKDVPSWKLSDSLWERIKPLLPKPKSRIRGRGKKRKHVGGRPCAEARTVIAGILYVLRTGCQWNAAPTEYGSGKTLHRYFQRWSRRGVFKKMWQAGLAEYDELKGLEWKWQAVDGAITKAPLGGEATGPNPTDRAKRGTKRSLAGRRPRGAVGHRSGSGPPPRCEVAGRDVGWGGGGTTGAQRERKTAFMFGQRVCRRARPANRPTERV